MSKYIKLNKVVAACGYFDPIHVGHIEYLEKAKSLGDYLIVIVNNDHQASLKKNKAFMSEDDRVKIVSSLRVVDEVFLSIDTDPSCTQSIKLINPHILAKGGDRFAGEIPEKAICDELGIEIIDGLGEKIRSSSSYLESVKK